MGTVATLLAIEFLDEFVFGAREAAWPLIRADLGLTYFQIGLLITVSNLVGAVVEPALAILSDAGHRRRIVLAGGVVFVTSLGAFALAGSYALLFGAALVLAPASGAFVGLSQATLMDVDPSVHERSMARWVVAGSIGVVVGPLLIAGAAGAGLTWRVPMLALAVLAVGFLLAARRVDPPAATSGGGFFAMLRGAARALRRREVVRWLAIKQATDLMGDALFGFLALYFVDVLGTSPAMAGVAVLTWTVAGLAGDIMLLPALARMDGIGYLRWSAVAVAVVFPAFLLFPGLGPKLSFLALLGIARAGWYAIPKGRLFTELAGASGTAVALSDVSDLIGRMAPMAVGALAERYGLGAAVWTMALAPAALLLGLPRSGAPGPVDPSEVVGG